MLRIFYFQVLFEYMNRAFKDYLLKITSATACEEVEVIQSLWSGYGKISRILLNDASYKTVVVKYIALNDSNHHPRGWNTDFGHNRKVRSYQVETHWYEAWSQHSIGACKIPTFLGSFSNDQDQWIVLEDLNHNFPLRENEIILSQVKVCLQWLANFHATFLGKKPDGLWEVGTYWNLDTRPDEFKLIEHQKLKSKAHQIDRILNQCKFQTIVHGDAKLANFCFSSDGTKVAAVDFQYVGGGCGMKDVAYFLGSCLSSSACERHENELMDYYFSSLKNAIEAASSPIDFEALEFEWRALYPVACTDFTRFLLGWMPSHQKINKYNLRKVNAVLDSL